MSKHMSKQVEFYFDFGSTASYLAWTRIAKVAAAAGATVVWRPMLLGGVFKATGNVSPVSVPAKGRWMMADLARCAAKFGVPFRMPPTFPVNTLALMRGAVGIQLQRPADLERYMTAIFAGMFAHGLDMADPAVVARVLTDAGFDPAAFEALVGDPAVKQALIAATDAAVKRGVFGGPTMFVGDEMHFGQDRLDFVADALRRN